MTAWFFANLAWASLFMLVVLAIRRPFAGLFGAGPAYGLWLLPVLRLFAPPLPAWGADISTLLPPETLLVWSGDAAASVPLESGPGQWVPLLLAIWAAGVVAFLVWQGFAYRRFLAELELSCRNVGVYRGLPLIESKAARGPLALGLIDRRIVVPLDFESRYSPAERQLALDHEAVHHRRGDIWSNHLGLFILAWNWFNPVAWIAFRAFRADQELACDAVVAGRACAAARHDYARALIKSASRPGLVAACPLNHADQLKRRLKMMRHHGSSKLRMLGGGAAVLVLAGIGISLGAPGLAHPQAEGEGVRKEERIVTLEHMAGGAQREGVTKNIRIRHGEHGEVASLEGCPEGSNVADVDQQDGNERTRVVLCGGPNQSPAERAQMIERARERMLANDTLSAEQRERIREGLERELARLRGR